MRALSHNRQEEGKDAGAGWLKAETESYGWP
jgi:hypothetical protein